MPDSRNSAVLFNVNISFLNPFFAHYEKRRAKYYRVCQETCSKSLRCTAFAFQPTSSDLNAKGNDCYFFDLNDDTKLVCDGLSEKIVQGERKG